jgi:hypothetical protein
MNMMTSLENIPLKTSSTSINDDSNDPIVKDILNELNSQLDNQAVPHNVPQSVPHNVPQSVPQMAPSSYPMPNQYVINNSVNSQKLNKNKNSYYNEEYFKKSLIIVVIIAFFFIPIIFNSIIDKLPEPLLSIFNSYEIYIKLILVFISIYLMMFYKMI